MAKPPALRSGLDDVGPVGDPIDDGLGQARVGKHLSPLAKGQVAGHDQRPALVALGDHLEHQLGGPLGKGQISKLIELCGHPHKSTYADLAVMPTLVRAVVKNAGEERLLRSSVLDSVGIIARLP